MEVTRHLLDGRQMAVQLAGSRGQTRLREATRSELRSGAWRRGSAQGCPRPPFPHPAHTGVQGPLREAADVSPHVTPRAVPFVKTRGHNSG